MRQQVGSVDFGPMTKNNILVYEADSWKINLKASITLQTIMLLL